jgi:hypothetical protein
MVSKKYLYAELAMPKLRWLVTDLSLQIPQSNPRAVHVGFVVDRMVQEQIFLKALQFCPVNKILSVLHNHWHSLILTADSVFK